MSSSDAQSNDLRKYLKEVERAEAVFKPWWDKSKKIVQRYRDEDRKNGPTNDMPARFNIFWSNIQTIQPALYARSPKPQVDRRYKDSDPVGRVASTILERCLEFSVDSYDFDATLRAVRDDYLLCGRGTAWVRYVPTMGADEVVEYEEVVCDHVHYRDFLHTPAKQWREVRGVGRYIYLNRAQLKDRFGNDLGAKIPLDYNPNSDSEEQKAEGEEASQARILEWWDSDTRNVVWISKAFNENVLDIQEDPLNLKGFFPTPKPLYGTLTTDSLVPVPDFCQYQDQCRNLDLATAKIDLLTDALQVRGVYDASVDSLKSLLRSSTENDMIPVHNWPAFQQGGGFGGVCQFMPLGEAVQALEALYKSRDITKANIYEITGIADVIRGNSSPSETATAQQIKGQFATLRLSDRQREVQRYAKDLIALKGELISEKFEPATMALMAGIEYQEPLMMQAFDAAVALLRNDQMRAFRIDIETDSTIAVDEALDKQKRTEFLQSFGGFLEGAVKASQGMPALAPVMGEALMFMVRGFNAGRSLESAIESAMAQMTAAAQEAMNAPKPDPEAMKAQAAAQAEMAKAQTQLQLKAQEGQMNLQIRQQEAAIDAEAHVQKTQADLQAELARKESDWQFKAAEFGLQQQKAQSELALLREKLSMDHDLKAESAFMELQLKQEEMVRKDELEAKKLIFQTAAKRAAADD